MTTERSTTKKAELKREKLLDAAKREFVRHGYDKATMASIACDAGLNKATLYYYYPGGKAELLGALVRRLGDEDHVAICEAVSAHTTRRARVQAYLRTRIGRRLAEMQQNGMTAERLFELFPLAQKASTALDAREREYLAGLLAPQADADAARHAVLIAEMVRRATVGWFLNIDYDTTAAETAEMVDAFVALMLEGALSTTAGAASAA